MLSFKQYINLLEGKADDFRAKYPHLSPLSDRHLVKYGQALTRMPDAPSDPEEIGKTLEHFDRHGSNLPVKDFGRYQSWNDVKRALQPQLEKAKTKEEAKEGKTIVHQEGPVTVSRIENQEAAKKYCAGTKWCVTSKGETGQKFWNKYAESGKNKMYLFNTPKGKYAYHEGEGGVMRNAENESVSIEDFVKEYPQAKNSEELRNSRHGYLFGNDQKAEEMAKIGDSDDKSFMAKHPKFAGYLIGDSDQNVRRLVARHPEHAANLINDPSASVRAAVAQHPQHAGKLVNDQNSYVRSKVAKHAEHAGKLINDESPTVLRNVARHPQHINGLMKKLGPRLHDDDPFKNMLLLRREVAQHPQHAGKLVKDPDSSVREIVARHPEHAGKLVNDSDRRVREVVARHPEHAGKLVNDEDTQVRKVVARHPEHAAKLINDPDESVEWYARETLRRKKQTDDLAHELSGLDTSR